MARNFNCEELWCQDSGVLLFSVMQQYVVVTPNTHGMWTFFMNPTTTDTIGKKKHWNYKYLPTMKIITKRRIIRERKNVNGKH